MDTLDKVLWTIVGIGALIGRICYFPIFMAGFLATGIYSVYQLYSSGALSTKVAEEAGVDPGDWGVLLVQAVSEIRTGEINAEPTGENYKARAMQLAAQKRFKEASE
jgi:hypothetical protein